METQEKKLRLATGAWVAMVTPFLKDGKIDRPGIARLVSFFASNNVSGIVPMGTTGETSTLNERGHHLVIVESARLVHEINSNSQEKLGILAGCGSNSTKEAKSYVALAEASGCDGALMVDPYYNGPSSFEIARHYYGPIAALHPNLPIVPYIIPGRTGCELSCADLGVLARRYPNICAVKQATGNMDKFRETRSITPPDFQIFSGDDDMTYYMMNETSIQACGVISVIANIAPAAVQKMCQHLLHRESETAAAMHTKLAPLFRLVTVSAEREVSIPGNGAETKIYKVKDKFRNPVGIKTMMRILGMPSGPCREPLGKMTAQGVLLVLEGLREVQKNSPEIFQPIAEFFGVNIEDRLNQTPSIYDENASGT